MALLTLVAIIGASWFLIDWPRDAAESFPGGVVLRDSTGRILRVGLGEGDVDCRAFYAANENDYIVKALVAAEDGAFWEHRGVRPLSCLRALGQNLMFRRRVSGASTITMQTIRLIQPHKKTYFNKFTEAIAAIKLEREHDKKWILSQYLNRAPFGSNLVGIESAAQGWFGKSADKLSLSEAALIAGMVQAPSRYRPDRNLERAIKRREYVLERMVKKGYISEEEQSEAREIRPRLIRLPRPFLAPYYCDWYLREMKVKGEVNTPLDPEVQDMLERVINIAEEEENCSFAGVVIKVDSGEIIALSCSGNYFSSDAGQVNTALSPRSAGSTLKPLLARQALSLGIIDLDSSLEDTPLKEEFGDYHPENFDGKYRGKVSLKEALVLSLNLPFVRLCREVGPELFGNYLRSLGFKHLTRKNSEYGLGMAIGNVEVTLVELGAAYRSLAFSSKYDPAAKSITEMLSGGERSGYSLNHCAKVKLPRFAWKTGTSSGGRDAWTICWNKDHVVAVWAGRKRGSGGEDLIGARVAAPVAWKIARALPRSR